MRPLIRLLPLLAALGCAAPRVSRTSSPAVDVRVDRAEAEAVIAVLDAQAAGRGLPDSLFARLTATAGYRRLLERESAMGRPLADSTFRTFLTSGPLRQRHTALRWAVERWGQMDVRAPAERAAAYLPPGTPLRATLFPVIKPRDNSFVFDLQRDPAFFVYVDPSQSPAELANVLAHELHHVGYAAACRASDAPVPAGPDSLRLARRAAARTWAGAFGEGIAMLAAAGGPETYPHATSPDSVRARWDRDVANAPADLARIAAFFSDVLAGRLDAPGAAREVAMGFYGEQGPWYTVGYVMARAIETTYGRPRLLAVLCDPAAFLRTYDEAAAATAGLPRWPAAVLEGLGAPARAR